MMTNNTHLLFEDALYIQVLVISIHIRTHKIEKNSKNIIFEKSLVEEIKMKKKYQR